MKLVVDSNVLFTYFWKLSFARQFLMRQELRLCSPEYALEEVNRHKSEIKKKTSLSEEEFKALCNELAIAVEFVPSNAYEDMLAKAGQISPDPNDVDFFALALKLNVPLWSNDALLKKQSVVRICSTEDLLNDQEFGDAVFPDE